QLLYAEHPYGHTPMGNEQALAALTVDDVRAFHRQAIRPDAATLVAVGDCDHAQIERNAAAAFAGCGGANDGGGEDAGPVPPASETPSTGRLYIIPRAGAP